MAWTVGLTGDSYARTGCPIGSMTCACAAVQLLSLTFHLAAVWARASTSIPIDAVPPASWSTGSDGSLGPTSTNEMCESVELRTAIKAG